MPVFAVITVANCTFSGAVVATFIGKYKQREIMTKMNANQGRSRLVGLLAATVRFILFLYSCDETLN